jgi:predicted Rossmann fold flavoprotein
LLESLNCPTKLERGRRVYPESDKASDVTRAFENAIRCADIRLNSRVAEIDVKNAGVKGLMLTDGEYIPCNAIVVATGGLSYPSTGSTGDGYIFAKQVGLEVIHTSPALVPIELSDDWVKKLSGLTLKNVLLTALVDGKEVFSKQGELLFTHFGISGPIAIALSSHITGIEAHRIDICLDMKPVLDTYTLMNRLQRECDENGSIQLNTLMQSYVPKSMVDILLELSDVYEKTKLAHLSNKDRWSIVNTLKSIPLHFEKLRPFEEAVITRGGISVDEIDPSTMQAKKISGLYFAGEVLDVDAYTGGYNLQIAFSTGALAGKSAAEYVGGKE